MAILSRILRRIADIPKRGLPNFRAPKVGDGCDGTLILTNPFSPNFKYGVKYAGCEPLILDYALSSLDIDHTQWSFIDVGCGKGRVLMRAEQYPYKSVIGVEYSPELASIARTNVKQSLVVISDAMDFVFPAGNKVVFMYHPFEKELFDRFLPRLQGKIILVYVGLGKDWAGGHPSFHEINRIKDMVVYEANL